MNTRTIVLLAVVQVALGASVPAKYEKCRYYCGDTEGKAYCCDDGSLPQPANHDTNPGACPAETEQLCKGPEDDQVFLKEKAQKLRSTASGSLQLSREGVAPVHCASDGYCSEDERCCLSPCAKRHVCLKALFLKKKGQ